MTSYTPHNGEQQHSFNRIRPFAQENENEAARLLLLHRQLSELMGGVLPYAPDLPWRGRVLDVGCGVGGWVYEMAWRYPSLLITGVDPNTYFVEKAQALVSGLDNVKVFAQNIHHLDEEVFPAGSFDLVHLRFLAREFTPPEFPALIQSLLRICRPGGSLVWTEAELPITTSLACQRLCTWVQNGLQAAGRAFCPGNALGVTAHTGCWLRDAGCRIKQDTAHALDISAGSKGHEAFLRQLLVFAQQVRPFLLEVGVATEAELEEVFLTMQQETQEERFCGILFLRTLVGIS
jgi:SAM-dependent methyltransferase